MKITYSKEVSGVGQYYDGRVKEVAWIRFPGWHATLTEMKFLLPHFCQILVAIFCLKVQVSKHYSITFDEIQEENCYINSNKFLNMVAQIEVSLVDPISNLNIMYVSFQEWGKGSEIIG